MDKEVPSWRLIHPNLKANLKSARERCVLVHELGWKRLRVQKSTLTCGIPASARRRAGPQQKAWGEPVLYMSQDEVRPLPRAIYRW